VIDSQATGSIKLNLTQVSELGKLWSSDSLTEFATTLLGNDTSANAGNLQGNHMFYTNDYMVHRGQNYVATVKMYSTRTQNTECVNSQNPLGFHLADGAVHTYLRGDEYEDIAAAWDWNFIPGITIDYGATPLECDTTQNTGLESFVGGVSDGVTGLAVMRYANPVTKFLRWQKVWFFLRNDVHHIMISNVSSTTNTPVYSVLDQRRSSGQVYINGAVGRNVTKTHVRTLWHGNVGYVFPAYETLVTVQTGEKSGNWSSIGTSAQPPATVDLFTAWIDHTPLLGPISYTSFPGIDLHTFNTKSRFPQLQSVRNDAHVSAVYDQADGTAMIVFWDEAGGSATFGVLTTIPSFTISSSGNAAVIYKFHDRTLVISDPSQTLSSVTITITVGLGTRLPQWGNFGRTRVITIELPQGGLAGSSITYSLDRSHRKRHH